MRMVVFAINCLLFMAPPAAPDLGASSVGEMQYVWVASRLGVLNPHAIFIGTVHYAHLSPTMAYPPEPDGDLHIWLTPDNAYFASMLRPNDRDGAPYGPNTLHVVVICDLPVAAASCGTFRNTVPLPPLGERVLVRGELVLDIPHNERRIQPAVSLVAI